MEADESIRYGLAVVAGVAVAASTLGISELWGIFVAPVLAWMLQWTFLFSLRSVEEILFAIPPHIREDRRVLSLAAISLPAALVSFMVWSLLACAASALSRVCRSDLAAELGQTPRVS